MKRKLFNPGLYLDSLRRTSLLGGLFTVLLCIQSFIMIFGFSISYTDIEVENIKTVVETLSLYEMNPCVLLVPVIMVPFLMVNLFGFLTRRSTSDFWHSTPFSRECIFITFTLAALSWALIAILLSTAISIIGFSLMPKLFAINFMSVWTGVLSIIAITLLVIGALTIATSLTGTVFNSIIVTAIILFLPRVLMVYFHTLTSNGMLFYGLPYEGFSSITLNLTFGLVFGVLFGEFNIPELFSSYTAISYTAALGIVYMIIGLVLFKHRKSEAASYSAVNKYLQTALRVIVSLIVCLVPIYMITESRNSPYGMDSEQYFVVFVLYIIAIAVYFIYELITTKKAKNMLKAIPALSILAIANIAMIIAITQTYKAEYNYTPTPQTVSTIRISESDSRNTDNYFEKVMSMTDINDTKLETLLCDLYAQTKKAYEDESIYNKYNNSITVGFKTNGKYKYRKIYMTDDEYAKFAELLDENQQIKNLYNIDNILKNAVHSDFSFYLDDDGFINDAQRKNIIDTYVKDVKKLPFNEWYYIANYPYENSITTATSETLYYNSIGEIYTSINVKGNTYYVYLPIDNRMTETYNMLMSEYFKYQKSNNIQQNVIDGIRNDKSISKDVNVELYNGSTKSAPEGYSLHKEEIAESFINAVTSELNQIPSPNSRIATVHYYTEAEEKWQRITAVFKIPDDADLSFFLEVKE